MPEKRDPGSHTDLFDYDAELHLHNDHLRAAARVGTRDRVLDIGCGAGQTTREAARAAAAGSAVGVDLSARMLQRARQLSEDEGLANVTYLRADAQTHRFPLEHFDLCISRFGTMFFNDPVAAFTNIGHALRPGARLVMLTWQDRHHNEWASAIRPPITAAAGIPASHPNPFSLADTKATAGILAAAGFTDVSFTDVNAPVYYGPDGASAFDAVLSLWDVNEVRANLDAVTAEQAFTQLRAYLDTHSTAGGVYCDSRAWIVRARRHSL